MGRRGYPPEFRRRVLDLIGAGRMAAGENAGVNTGRDAPRARM